MRIAIVWNYPSRLSECSFRFEQYVEGFQSLGYEAVIVCTVAAAQGFAAPFHLCKTRADFADTAFWREVGADVALIVTWHRMSDVLAAIGKAGTAVIAFADTDGQVSHRLFPRAMLRQALFRQKTKRLKAFLHWLRRYAREWGGASTQDVERLQSTRHSDALVFGHGEGKRHFERILRRYGAESLSSKVVVTPFTIGRSYFTCPVPTEKDDCIVAIGRWGDPQKNAPLLARALSLFLEKRPQTHIVLFGADGASIFRPLVNAYPSVSYRGLAGPDVVAQTLARSRSILFASRWDGCPHAALEALAMGATIIGTPLPSLISWCEGGRFGRVSRRHHPQSLVRALRLEMEAWDEGRRDGKAIATTWRSRVEPTEVCRRLLEAWNCTRRK